ncbi:MAG: sigma-70 family RNA polymerase sigma factor [Thermoleophilaceae bacterium]|nr:sigma-70 family RNA polymerase sigma factor [Thermoleophilaceae bacterium]
MQTNLRDPEQFRTAYTDLMPLARTSAERVLRDSAAAEDVAQEVFVGLWRNPDAFDPKRGSLPRYVSMMSRSRALDRWRTRTARAAALERSASEQRTLSSSITESAAEPAIQRERSRTALRALSGLPSEQREAVLLAFGRGLTAQEIASAEKIPLGTAKSRVRLGLQKARENVKAAA